VTRPTQQQTKARKTGQADSIAESKLDRVKLIAKEALDILGEESPDSLRKAHSKAIVDYNDQITNLEHRLKGAAEQVKSVEGELRHSTRLASDRLEEAERVWDVAAEQSQQLKSKQADLDEQVKISSSQSETISKLKHTITESGEAASELQDKLTTEIASTTEQRDEALSQYEHAQSQLVHIRDELAERSARLSETQAAVTIAREQIAEIETSAEISLARIEELESLNIDLAEALDALKESEADAQTQLNTARSEMAELTGKLASRDQTIAKLSEQVNTQATATHTTETAPIPVQADQPEDQTQLQAELDARTTEAAYMAEQMERADDRAKSYRDRMEHAELSLEKAHSIVMRARRRASLRTQQYSDTIEAMSALHVRYDVLKGELRKAESMASRHLLIGRLSGGAAITAAVLALISAF